MTDWINLKEYIERLDAVPKSVAKTEIKFLFATKRWGIILARTEKSR